MSKLKKLIKKRGYTIIGLAKKMGLNTIYIYNWINKYNPSAKYMFKLCEILKCKPEDILK